MNGGNCRNNSMEAAVSPLSHDLAVQWPLELPACPMASTASVVGLRNMAVVRGSCKKRQDFFSSKLNFNLKLH